MTGVLQDDTFEIPQHTMLAQFTQLYSWLASLLRVDNAQKTDSFYGPIAKSGLGLPENIAHTIASHTY